MNSKSVHIFFIAFVVSILFIIAFYVSYKVHSSFQSYPKLKKAILILIPLIIVLQFLGIGIYRNTPVPSKSGVLGFLFWSQYTLVGWLVFSFLILFAFEIVTFIQRFLPISGNFSEEKRMFLNRAVLGGTGLIALQQAFSVQRCPEIKEVKVSLKRLPKNFSGYTIAQITDLHVGPTIRGKYLDEVVKKVNEMGADLVVLTGDFVDGTVSQIGDEFLALKNIKSKDGVLFITGNHEYYWGHQEWIEHFKTLNVNSLINESVKITRDNESIHIVGVPDEHGEQFDALHFIDHNKALGQTEAGNVKILLAHRPGMCLIAEKYDYDLQLSGHTHGGQFFPFSILAWIAHPYLKGLHFHKNKMWVYVSCGTGYWGPPLRFANPAEITKVILT